jgi:hypothetical protein
MHYGTSKYQFVNCRSRPYPAPAWQKREAQAAHQLSPSDPRFQSRREENFSMPWKSELTFGSTRAIGSTGWWCGTFFSFPFSWECHPPNWRTPSFFRGVGSTTNQKYHVLINRSNGNPLHMEDWMEKLWGKAWGMFQFHRDSNVQLTNKHQ